MTKTEFQLLLKRNESDTLDFKATGYDLSSDHGKFSLVKDVIAMTNTPRDDDSFIVTGVKKHSDNSFELIGVASHPDDANLQSQFVERIYPIPSFTYEVIHDEGLQFGLFRIPPIRIGPCVPLRDYGDGLRRLQLYYRRQSKNDIATPEDISRILAWFGRSVAPRIAYLEGGPPWETFLREVHNLEPMRQYLLIVNRVPINSQDLTGIGVIPWSATLDFDPDSDVDGLLAAIKMTLQERRGLHIVTMQERPNLNLRSGTYWHFARGLTGRDKLEIGKWQDWQRTYGAALNDQLRRIAGGVAPDPVTIVALWYGTELSRHLRTALEASLAAFGDSCNLVVVTDDHGSVLDVAKEIEAAVVEIPFHQLCSGLRLLRSATPLDGDSMSLPTISGAPLAVSLKDRKWLEEELELVALESGQVPFPDRNDIGTGFLQGNEITWYDLGISSDVERDVTSKLSRQIRHDLDSRRTARINLYHAPGAGGTTVSKRAMWSFHREHPCLVLKSTVPAETADRISHVTSATGMSVLVIVDGAAVVSSQVDELYDQLRARQIPVVIVQVIRRFTAQTESQRSFFVREELSQSEAYRFRTILARERPDSAGELDKLARTTDARFRTAFYFGLVAFKEDFKGLSKYVQARLVNLTEVQSKILAFLSIAHHYGQKTVPAQAFADLLLIPKSRSLDLAFAMPTSALELLVSVQRGIWRTAHDLVAIEILKQLLWPASSDRRQWKQNLSKWALDFADFCRGTAPVPSEILLDVVRRVFVYRDNSEVLGTERSGLSQFSQLIDDIPSTEGALQILRRLCELYPDEPHFWAHLGRFYSVERRDFPAAVEAIDRALALNDRDNVLHHMKGMALRQQAYDDIEKDQSLDEIIDFAKKASSSFTRARELSPDDEHGYISEVQMLLRLLDYAARKNEGGILAYVRSQSADPFLRESFQRVEDLLESVRRNREGEGASQYETRCRGELDVLYGKHESALQTWNQLLDRKDVYAPPVRRQLVWTYLARHKRSWYAVTPKEIDKIVELLEHNLREEPEKDSNLRLWVQAVRRSTSAPTTEAVIEQVGYWRTNANSLESIFYSYVFYALQCIEGSSLALDQATRFIEECRTRTRFNRNRTKSLEWLGKGSGITRLVHHSQLGNWDRSKDFWEHPSLLFRATGRISRLDAPQSGQIEVQGGLKAFFVPARGNYSRGRSENQAVTFFLGFSYEGLRAWEVKDA